MKNRIQNVTLAPTQAVIVLIGASESDEQLYEPTQIGDISIEEQETYLKQFCQRKRYNIFAVVEVSEDGKEFEELANRFLKDDNQDKALVSENFARLSRKPKALRAFKKVFQQPLKEEKIDLVAVQNELFT